MTTSPDSVEAMVERLAQSDLARTAYARALEAMRKMLDAVHDGLEDEGDRIYLGSTNHADNLHETWHLADTLNWDEILAHTQPKTPLAETNRALQSEVASQAQQIAALRSALGLVDGPMTFAKAAGYPGIDEITAIIDAALSQENG